MTAPPASPSTERASADHASIALDRDILTLAWVARRLERSCAEITVPQYRLLAMVALGDERASSLASRLDLARPTVSATVDTLVERGLLERTAVDGDRRAVRLGLTPLGHDTMRTAEHAMREKLDGLLELVAEPELVRRALDQLGDAMAAKSASRQSKEAPR
ncbi:MAG: MarR family transcriptional regulator [Acidimicrobiia bacterium]